MDGYAMYKSDYLDSIAQASYLFIVRLTIIYTFCILHIWFRDC